MGNRNDVDGMGAVADRGAVAGASAMTAGERERWTRVGMLSALALVLGYLETFIPIPIPGVKLGLANIAVLMALDADDVPGAFCVGAIKVLAVGLLFGNPVTMAYSAAGTLLAFAVMAPLSGLAGIHVVAVSAAGALAHVAGQLVVAQVILGTPLVWYGAAPLAVAAVVTGVLCGVVTSRALTVRDGWAAAGAESGADEPSAKAGALEDEGPVLLPSRPSAARVKVNPKAALVALIAFMVVVFNVESAFALAGAVALAAIACVVGRVPARALVAALRPLLLIVVITFAAQVASFQQGDVVAQLGPIAITSEALRQTGVMVARLAAVVGASAAVMQLVDIGARGGAIRWLASPLERLGVRTEGFGLALEVALASVPSVLALAREQSWDWRSLGAAAPEFIAKVVS